MALPRPIHDAARFALRHFVPEAYWPETVDVDGVAIRLRNTPYTFSTRRLIKSGHYERPERELCKKSITPGMNVIEFGGSIGIVTSVVTKLVGPEGRVFSVEASESLTDFSKTWLPSVGNVEVLTGFAFPVWERPRGLRLGSFEKKVSLGGQLEFKIDKAAPTQPAHDEEAGPVSYDLRTICEGYGVEPHALVMDIEASERIMLDTPPNYPDSLRVIVAELHPGMYPKGEEDERAILDVYRADGFEVREHVHHSWLLTR